MAKYIQIGLQINTDSDPEPEVQITPVDSKLPEQAGNALATGIALADLSDAVPGSGKYEVDTKLDIPIKLFGKLFRVKYPVRVTVEVVHK